MNSEITVKVTGSAGQGMQTIGLALCRVFARGGFHIFASQDYMSRIRGGNNVFQVRVSTSAVHSFRSHSQITVPLDPASVDAHKGQIAHPGVMITDKARFGIADADERLFDVPLYALAHQAGSELFVNAVACGVIMHLMEAAIEPLNEVIRETFADKGEGVIGQNIAAARAGFDYAAARYKGAGFALERPARAAGNEQLLIEANEAIALGAVRAGCRFYAAYPMTPSTNILQTMARCASQSGVVVEQAEDEIAAINMAIGASFAGARAMTGTSGGGFALMVEGVSLAGMTETPVVVALAQRPGPATGFPTRTAQEDLFMVLYAGHGEFPRAVYTPGNAEEAFELTCKAFETAEKYQIPAFILSDQVLADSYRNIGPFPLEKTRVRRHIISRQESSGITGYKRYALTESGISPRAVPSWIDEPLYVDSDEHTEEGHITERADVRVAMVDKRLFRKMRGLAREVEAPVIGGDAHPRLLLIGFGSTGGVIRDVCAASGGVGFVHLKQVWPFPGQALLEAMHGAGRICTVENNATGQLCRLIRQETGREVETILKYDGRPFSFDELQARVEKVLENDGR